MNKRLPKIFHDDINKDVNSKAYYSYKDENSNFKAPSNNKSIDKFDLGNIYYFINQNVEIILNNDILTGKIIAKIDDHLIMGDGMIVMLKDIIDIKIK